MCRLIATLPMVRIVGHFSPYHRHIKQCQPVAQHGRHLFDESVSDPVDCEISIDVNLPFRQLITCQAGPGRTNAVLEVLPGSLQQNTVLQESDS